MTRGEAAFRAYKAKKVRDDARCARQCALIVTVMVSVLVGVLLCYVLTTWRA